MSKLLLESDIQIPLGATKSGEESNHTPEPFPSILFAKAHLIDYYDKFISFHRGDGDYLKVA